MMISPSRDEASTKLFANASNGKEVTRLEFHSLDCMGDDSLTPDVSVDESEVATEDSTSLEMRLEVQAREIQAKVDAARKEARTEAREEWAGELDIRIADERARVTRMCEVFVRDRNAYFLDVEAEVVRLSLAIAARILHREATIDPLLLAGVVRVALGKVAGESAVVLRVPTHEIGMWTDVASNVVGDERMMAGECVLETSVGKVELGVGAQLEEIERGFFDLLQRRPS
jgi:flagellar assembly protein FliH